MVESRPVSRAPLTAFVLAGGGSLGAVQVGMLEALVARGVRADLVVGASVGAVNGAYYAATPDSVGVRRLEKIWCGLRRNDVFPHAATSGLLALLARRSHLFSPMPFAGLLRRHLPYERLEDARIPCHVIATDVLSGEEVRLSRGPLVASLCATAALPGLHPPVEIGGRYLMDGGVANHTPISAAVALGAERVIVLPTGVPCALERPPRSAVGMALHALNLLTTGRIAADVARFSTAVELIVVPPLCPFAISSYDFGHAAELIARAEASTKQWLADGGLEQRGVPASLEPHGH
ncbi:MAG: patatin-like phospholipase family protein [Gemmatimonadetes bacterium]|nr:patatin-like phospholipase family protein [Gemmatimonadota bacterium]